MKEKNSQCEVTDTPSGSFEDRLSGFTRGKLLEAAQAMGVDPKSATMRSFEQDKWPRRFLEMVAMFTDHDMNVLAECIIAIAAQARARPKQQ
jgi:hypothetical protein